MLYIEDDGVGMTEEEFQNHWMKLRYNRLKYQGKNVVFPEGVTGKRTAFGRNGVGRHGLFCFADEYKAITEKNGKKLAFTVKANIDHNPIAVTEKTEEECHKIDDAYYKADGAYSKANDAYQKAEEAYEKAEDAYERADEAYFKAE